LGVREIGSIGREASDRLGEKETVVLKRWGKAPSKGPVESIVGQHMVEVICAAAFLALSLLGAFAPVAGAQPAHPNYVGAGKVVNSGSAEPGEVLLPRHIAVDPQSGRVLVSDSGHGRVATYFPESGALNYQESFGSGILTSPYGVAIDSSSHFVYVSDPGTGKIVRFTYSPGPVPAFTVDNTYPSPTLGSGPNQLGSFKVALAVDPTSGDLLVADTSNKRVSRYAPSGAFVSSFNGAAAVGGPFTGPLDVAVGPSGEVVVADSVGPLVLGRVERFASNGNWLGNLEVARTPRSVGINQATGMVSVGESPRAGKAGGGLIESFIDGEAAGEAPLQFGLVPTGIAMDPSTGGQLYTVTNEFENQPLGNDGVEAFSPVRAPGASVLPASDVTTESADLSGEVDAGGLLTSAHFEYSTDKLNWTPLPDLGPLEGNGAVEVHGHLANLDPNRQYFVRLVATNESTGSTSSPRNFTTVASPPAVVTLPASGITAQGATLNGRVTPFGASTTFYFEYGETPSYGYRAPIAPEGLAGAGRIGVGVSRTIGDLTAETTYHFRLVAKNAIGVALGPDSSFTTGTNGVTPRVYEQVSPADKQGQTLNLTQNFQAAAMGNSASFVAGNASPGAVAAPAAVHLLSTRSTGGWGTLAIDPPATTTYSQSAADALTGNISEDLAHSLVLSNRVLAPGAVAERQNLYIRDNRSGTYTFVTTLSLSQVSLFLHGQGSVLYSASENWEKVVIEVSEALTTEGTQGVALLYQYSTAGLKVVSRLPGGTPIASGGGGSVRAMSSDGDRLAFSASGGGVYLRENEVSTAVSVSQRPGDTSAVQPARYIDSSSDGRYLFFQSQNESPLTTDAPEAPGDIYRFDADSGSLLYLEGTGGISAQPLTQGSSPVSSDGSTLIYTGVFEGAEGLFRWRDGASRVLIPIFEPEALKGRTENASKKSLSDNGRWLVLDSSQPLTGQSSANQSACSIRPTNYQLQGNCPQIFRVDTTNASIVCVSCMPDGSPPAGISDIGTAPLGLHEDRPVDDDGDVFFDTPNPLVSEDANGGQDVYEFSGNSSTLVSGAEPGHESFFADASVGGNDLFFFTDEELVGQDRDAYMDVYDARRGGGIASQEAGPAILTCSGEECRNANLGQPPGSPSAGSESVGRPPTHKAHLRPCRKRGAAVGGKRQVCGKHTKHPKHTRHSKHAKRRSSHNRRHAK
jgi:hypothetical protein